MKSKLGIIGGGQLALMIIQSASKFGIECICLDPNPQAPAFKYASKIIVAGFGDKRGLEELENLSDVIVYEFENVNLNNLKTIAEEKLYQGVAVLEYGQNRIREKNLARKSGLKTVDFAKVSSATELANASKQIGFPAILKTTELGYDGKGQLVLASPADLNQAVKIIEVECIYEQMIDFDYEMSIIAVRDYQNNIVCFEPVINEHHHGILHKTIYNPEMIDEKLAKEAKIQIQNLMEDNQFYGILCIEFFVKDQELYFNEMAPRPHNSGHVTMDATTVSQFDNLVRAAVGLPLETPKLLQPMAMYNILGQHLNQAKYFIEHDAEVQSYFYGKDEAKENRKMGHLNVEFVKEKMDNLEKEVFGNE